MNKYCAILLLAMAGSLLPPCAPAQSLPYGAALGPLQATTDTASGQTTITGTLHNHGERVLPSPSVTFVLYDEQGREIDRIVARASAPLPPGATWDIRETTPHRFVRFTALHVKAE
ncbi:FxLYD domain-containing protein [Bordetella sp. 2513F-2]